MDNSRYHVRGGVYSTSSGGERLDLDEKTLGDAFKAAGYATGAFGKWHNGSQYPYHPNARGFDEYYGFPSGHWGNYFSPILEHNGELVRGKGFIIDDLTDHALEFVEQSKDQPFLCYLPYNTPHSPMQVPDRFYKKFENLELDMRNRDAESEDIPKTRAALAMVENIDWNVGRLLQKLDDLNLAEDTIVLYFSDNGPNSWRWNAGMKGRKGSTDEGGTRVPALMRWPGHIQPGTKITQIAAAIDLLPTFADLAGIPVVGDKPLDGVSLKPLLLGDAGDWPDRMIFSHWRGKVSVRTQRHRLGPAGGLFDMTADPGQLHDVASENPEVTKRLADARDKWSQELLLGLLDDDRAFPVGYREFPTTWLPARDGVSHGGVTHSARAPNCSFFTNWTRAEDRMTWDIEVAESGRYEAVVYYTCAPADVGSTIELSFNGARVQGMVSEAYDPPLLGAENDRTPRGGESYVKDFKPLLLGVFEMKQGRGELALRASDIAGKQVMDVRFVKLTLLH